ncbi:M1 family aminopeptidase [Luteococcus sp. Sow4_B9]|uniref:M1 family aminopeptidase n=1 Tax=Luteococcus sp. Sow4_B9 TaxID=3438792 RepID=UPI003F9B578B
MDVELWVRIDPESGDLSAEAELTGFEGFFLHRDLDVTSSSPGVQIEVSADVSVHLDRAHGYRITGGDKVRLSYSGSLPSEMADGTNVLTSDVAELSIYSAWYPVPLDLGSFTWRLHLDLPSGWTFVSNGAPGEGGSLVHDGTAAVGDIALAGARRFVASRLADGVELVTCGSVGDAAGVLGPHIVESLSLLKSWYGEPDGLSHGRVVVTERGGYAYSRMPTVFASAEMAERLTARTVHTLGHELAHFWWNIAPVHGYDDWLNEALAEYSALRLTEELCGADASDKIVRGYQLEAEMSREDPPVCRTEPDDEKSYATNKYNRGSLFFRALSEQLEPNALDALLTRFHDEHAVVGDATTDSLLRHLGAVDQEVAREAAQVLESRSWDGRWPSGAVLTTIP